MKIPKRINPDNLKDTIVQVVFDSDVPSELILGVFYFNFTSQYTFVATSPINKEIKLESEGLTINQFDRGFFIDKDSKVKVEITPNSIVFNSLDNYIGWENYYPLIALTINKLFESKIIKEVIRIGVRYISQFNNTALFDNLEMNLKLNIPNNNFQSTQIRSEFVHENFTVILTLLNNIKPSKLEENEFTSIIDIDVVLLKNTLHSANQVLEQIEKAHQKQKETFFSLLKPDFLTTLNPEY